MSINLIKEEIRTGEVICQKYSQTMVESDIIVPDIKPDIKKVLEVSGNACITQKLIQQDKVFIQGVVKMTVLYVPDGTVPGKIKGLTASQEFNHTIDCRGAMPDMQITSEVDSESFDCTMLNSRKLNLRGTLSIGIKIIKPVTLSISTDIENGENIALKKDRLRIINGTDSTECQIILREQLELPAGKPSIGEILKVTATPSSTELCMMDGKAVAKGQVKICALYSGDDEEGSIQFTEHILPFTEILDIDGITEDMEGEIEYSVNDMYYEARDDSDGEPRNLGIELVLCATVRGSEISDIEAITDAYSLKNGLDLTTKAYKIEQLLDNSTAEISHKDQAQLPPMLPRLKQVCDVNSDVKIDRITAENGQITAYGTIHTNILYLSDDENTPISEFNHNSEFSQTFTVPDAGNDTACDARTFMEHISYTLSGNDSLELRFVIGLTVKSLKTGNVIVIEDMSEYVPEDEPELPCIIIYFVQKGDTLWNIAKRYHTTVEDIKNLNKLESDTIYPGQRIRIVVSGNICEQRYPLG